MSFFFLTPSAPPNFLHPGTDCPACLWRDNPCHILHSKVLGFIRKSYNVWPPYIKTSDMQPHGQLKAFEPIIWHLFLRIHSSSLGIQSLLRSVIAFPDPTIFIGNNIISFLWSLGWMSIHAHKSMVPKWCLLCNICWKITKACCGHQGVLARSSSLRAPPTEPPQPELLPLVAHVTSISGQFALRSD